MHGIGKITKMTIVYKLFIVYCNYIIMASWHSYKMSTLNNLFQTPFIFVCSLGYVKLILDEVVQLRSRHNTLNEARKHAKKILPPEPCSLVEKYLKGKQRPSKKDVLTVKRSRFSKPALPLTQTVKKNSCSCKGKCATKKCICKSSKELCSSECTCSKTKCHNSP